MNLMLEILVSVFNPLSLLLNIIGVILGIFFGAMPGLNGVVGVALLLPLTYGMTPSNGLIMLSGLYMGATYGGSISAILLNVPGTGEAACTALNGNPLAKQGRAKEALFYAVFSSALGGIFGVIIMIFFTPILARMALKFGPPELFLVCVAGLVVVGSLMGKSISKGFFAVGFGLLLSIVGVDTMSGNYRFAFGSGQLQAGLSLIPVSVGIFAISEMLVLIKSKDESKDIYDTKQEYRYLDGVKETFKRWRILLKSSIIGTIIGILPGTGGAIASFVSYGEAQRTSKESHMFGKGSIDGIIAPEAANNAAVGGSFVPLLSLGIPGSATSAIIFGALTVHGLIPGPRLFADHSDVVYALMFGLLLSVFIMLFIGITGINLFSKILLIKKKYIIPAVIVFSLIGAYSARNSLFDVLIAIIFGVIGLWFKRAEIPVAPVVLGMILGRMAEENLRRSLVIAGAKGLNLVTYIFLRPVSVLVLVLVIFLVVNNVKSMMGSKNSELREKNAE